MPDDYLYTGNRNITLVQFALLPISKVGEITTVQLVNVAGGDQNPSRNLGILTLNHDEYTELTRDIYANQSTSQYTYENWLATRLSDPTHYQINGKPLSLMSITDQIQTLNLMWRTGKNVDKID